MRNHKHDMTTDEKRRLSVGIRRLLDGGRLTDDEAGSMRKLSWSLDRPMPKHACKNCWLQRVLDGTE